jgi:GT2 family glycosyltransferase
MIVGSTRPVVEVETAGALGSAGSEGCSVVIVTFNNESCIAECLHSVLLTLDDGDEVIVVDNASSDKTLEVVCRFLAQTSRLKIVENPTNLGYSAGCNVGLKASSGQHLVLLNPDTIVWPRWLEKMKRAFREGVGAVGPMSDNVGGVQYIGHDLEPGIRLQEIQDHLTEQFARQSVETKLLIGFCLLLRRDIMDRIGILDENLFLGNDDLELSWRIRTHDLKLVVAKDVFVHHKHHVSFKSLECSKVHELIQQSGTALETKLKAYYGEVLSDEELWGVTFRDEALDLPSSPHLSTNSFDASKCIPSSVGKPAPQNTQSPDSNASALKCL